MPGERILIVEDEGIVADGIQSVLEDYGYDVASVVASGEEALRAAARDAPDLVLMDIRLEGPMDGIEASKRIRESADVAVVYLTAYADEETLSRAVGTEPFGYVVKPFEARELAAAVQMALQKQRAERKVKQSLAEVERLNEELAYQKRFFETLFDTLPCGVLVVNRQVRIWTLNPALEATLGEGREAALARPMADLLGCEGHHEGMGETGWSEWGGACPIHRAIGEAFEGRPVRRRKAEVRLRLQGEPRHVELLISAANLRFEGEDLCVVVLEDVTELGNLRRLLETHRPVQGIVGQDSRMLELYEAIREVAESRAPVLIQGQSGVGKELVAEAIHRHGPLSGKPFVAVYCGALSEGLLESELFGHVAGAFTGAARDKKGRFELADGGTLFLDEVGELAPQVQVKLLRVLQSGTFERLGAEETVRVNVRILSATHRDLSREVAEGRFREDLFYRLAVVPITVPPLSERRGDIPLLAAHFLSEFGKASGQATGSLSAEALALLMAHPWPGNVRELKNVLQYAHIKSKGEAINPDHLPLALHAQSKGRPPQGLLWKSRLEPGKVLDALRKCKGNKMRAAKLLGVSRSTLYRFIEDRFGAGELPS